MNRQTSNRAFSRPTLVALLVLLNVYGCGATGEATRTQFPENRSADIRGVIAQLERAKPKEESSVGVGVTTAPSRLLTWDAASGKILWEKPLRALSAPILAGQSIVMGEPGGIVVRDAKNGQTLYTIDGDSETQLIGADGDGSLTAITLQSGPRQNPSGRLVLLRDGSLVLDQEFGPEIGNPAVLGSLVFVPWNTKTVSVIDASTRAERARVRIDDLVVGHAQVVGNAIYLGQRELVKFSQSLESGSKANAPRFAPTPRQLPAQPGLMRDGYAATPPPENAAYRVRLVWKAAGGGNEVAFVDDNLYFVLHRFVFALDPKNDGVRWAYVSEADIVGARAVDGALRIADQSGNIVTLSAKSGEKSSQNSIGRPLVFMRIPKSGFAPAKDSGKAVGPRAGLAAVTRTNDPRVAAGRVFAVRHLARIADPEVTRDLIEICGEPTAPEPVIEAACPELAARDNGGEFVIHALGQKGSFLHGQAQPPVGPLAEAAARMKLKAAGAPLLEQLKNPYTKPSDLPKVVYAIGVVGDAQSTAALRDFVRMYRADASDASLAAAVNTALDAIALRGGSNAGDTLKRVAEEPFSTPPVREHASLTLSKLKNGSLAKAPQGGASDAKTVAPGKAESPSIGAPSAAPVASGPAKPARLTDQLVVDALAPVKKQLEACLDTAPSKPPSARVAILVTNDGVPRGVFVTPSPIQGCVESLVKARRFPETSFSGRDQVTYTIVRP